MVPMTTSRGFFDGEEHGYVLDANMEGNVARYLKVCFYIYNTTCFMPYSSNSIILLESFYFFQISFTFCPLFL